MTNGAGVKETAPLPLGLVRCRDGIKTYEALTSAGERIFVKRLDASASPLLQRRFAREKRLAQTLTHPAIAAPKASGGDWFACEYLEDALDRPEIVSRDRSETAVRTLIGELAGLLAYLHELGIAHGDIKPAHIRFRRRQPGREHFQERWEPVFRPEMRKNKGIERFRDSEKSEAVLVDFGIAAIGDNDPLTGGEIVGTPRWMAPEQMRAGAITPAGDIWSLCSIGLWLLEGRLPLAGSFTEVLSKRDAGIDHEFDLTALTEGGLAALLARGLAHAPHRRPTATMLTGALCGRSASDQSITSVTAG